MEDLINPSCPYAAWEPSTLIWCEQQLCSWVREPANAWSNLSYVIFGIWMINHCWKTKYGHLRLLGSFSILIGLMSFFYHATSSFIGEVFDYSAMFFISTFFICMAIARLRNWSYLKVKWWAVGILIPSIALLVKFKILGAFLFGVQIAAAAIMEIQLYKRFPSKPHYRWAFAAVSLFLAAYGVWTLDKERIVCSPTTHWISGHAIWHLMTAAALLCMYRFYHQFTLNEPPNKTV
jgi:hypothetical protein